MEQYPIIFFDGICNFCNGAVNFVIRNERKCEIKFATLQSDIATQLLNKYGIPKGGYQSFFFLENGKVYTSSTAAIKVCRYLKGLWPLMIGFIIVPRFIRDGIYNVISKNRYRWFGKKETCMIPSPELKSKFLND